jgi:oligopeptide transport system ATP-binding protein
MPALLEVSDLHKRFTSRRGVIRRRSSIVTAVDGVSFDVVAGETLGLVGESGSGKTTLVRSVLFLDSPTSGEVRFAGQVLTKNSAQILRRRAQIVFQDPYTSLPPRMRIGDIVADPLRIHGIGDRRAVAERTRHLMQDVGLTADIVRRYPHELSGGQRQRVGIARALAVEPALLIADEAVSSLDLSVRAQILNLLKDLRDRLHLTTVFVSHDLSVVRHMSDRIAVMYLGEIVELAAAGQILAHPLHPYTRALLSAVPKIGASAVDRVRIQGEPPDPGNPPPGCKFHPRCPIAQAICRTNRPAIHEWHPGHTAACHFALAGAEATRESAPRLHDIGKQAVTDASLRP